MIYIFQFTMIALIAISIYMLFSAKSFKGKEFLYIFFLLILFARLCWIIPNILLQNGIIEHETFREFIRVWRPFSAIINITAWIIMLIFIVRLRSLINNMVPTDPINLSGDITYQNNYINETGNAGKASDIPSYWPGVILLTAAAAARIIGEVLAQSAIKSARGAGSFFGAGSRLQTAANIEGTSTAIMTVLGLIGIILLIRSAVRRSCNKPEAN